MSNSSLFAAFERMWQNMLSKLNDYSNEIDGVISQNAANIATIKEDLDAFFADADMTESAKDTLKELQAYIASDETGAAAMLASIVENANRINSAEALLAELKEGLEGAHSANQHLITDENGTVIWAKNPYPCDISGVPALGDLSTDDSVAIQELLDKYDYVYLPVGTYYIAKNPLKMTRERCTFVCDGSLIVNTTCALELQASYCHVKIARIDSRWGGTWNETDKWKYLTSAIKVGSNTVGVSYNTVEVDAIERSINGLWLCPNGEGLGVAHNTFTFKNIQAERCIYFNPSDHKYVYINGNHFYGGHLRGNHPIYTEKGASQTDRFNGNTFHHLAMEGCQKPMVLKFFYMNQFKDLRLAESENTAITYPDPLIVFDEYSYGNTIESHEPLNIDRIIDPYKDGESWTAIMGNVYKPKGIRVGELSNSKIIGYEARSTRGQFIVPNDNHRNVTGWNEDIDMSADSYAIDGLICYVVANSRDVDIKLSKGYCDRGAMNLYVYVAQIDSPTYNVKVTQFDEATQTYVDITPASMLTEVGLYKLECVTGVGWITTKVDADDGVAIKAYVDEAIADVEQDIVEIFEQIDNMGSVTMVTDDGEGNLAFHFKGGSSDSPTDNIDGAVGDGITDDADVITQALENSKYVTFDGTKTYAISYPITIPADAHVDFCGATLVPLGNHDVIRVKPGSFIENLVIRCTEVPGWDSSAIVFYGGDAFRASNPTRANNLKLYNDTNYNNGYSVGNGIYLYLDEDGRYLEGINISNAMTSGFGYGIRMSDLTDAGEPIAAHGFIGANTFSNYWSYRDKIGICIDSKSTHCITTNNFFTDLNIQSDYYNSSECAIYCRGDSNYFSGCLYDYVILDYHPTAAVYFDVGSTKNFVEVTAGMVNKAGFCVDLGNNNKVVKKAFEDTIITPANRSVGFFGNQDDAFAYLDKRADCTLESLDVEPTAGDISCVFDPSPNKTLIYHKDPSTGLCRARITINLRRVLREMSHLILQFSHRRSPTTVKVTVYNATDAVVIYDVTNNAETEIRISPDIEQFDAIPNIAKIVIELGGTYSFSGINPTYWEISRILAADKYGVGNTWLGRDGGEIYGNVKFGADNGIVLTDAEGKKYKLTVSTDGVLGTAEYIEEEEEAPEVATLVPTMAAGTTWFNSALAGVEQNTITSVAFDSSYEPTGNEDASWACDDSGVGYIMAYRNGTEVTIASTTGSDGVKLNKDSTYMFANDGTKANFASLASITGTETWSADKDTDMTAFLRSNTVIVEPPVIPVGAYITNNMFTGCYALVSPPVIPEGVVSMANMFSDCIALKTLPTIPSTVIKMHYAFATCRSVTDVDITIPEKVFQINAAFRNCFNMNGTVTVNAANLTEYGACFENTCRDSGSVVLTGTNAQLAELAATNTHGKVTVA